jgi:hypothetical protein
MSKNSNKKLNISDRVALREFASRNISCKEEEAIFQAAYKTTKQIIIAAVEQKFPKKDMLVLQKYGAAIVDLCIRFGSHYNTESKFQFFKLDQEAPLVPNNGGCHTRTYDFNRAQMDQINTYVLARQKLENARKAKLEIYARLINGSITFNDVVEVWPAAEALRAKIIPKTTDQRALAVLSQEALAMIKSDNAGAEQVTA